MILGLQVQTGFSQSASLSQHLLMWQPTATHFPAILGINAVTAGLFFLSVCFVSQDTTVKANGNKLQATVLKLCCICGKQRSCGTIYPSG